MTGIDYAPLASPVTREHVAEYRKSLGNSHRWNSIVLPYLIVGIWILLIVAIVKTDVKATQNVRLSRFAKANGFTFTAVDDIPDYPGSIFGFGDLREMPELLSRVTPSVLELGNYGYSTGSGKSRRTWRWGFMAIRLDRKLPHMIVGCEVEQQLVLEAFRKCRQQPGAIPRRSI